MVIREMQTKVTMVFFYTPIRWLKLKRLMTANVLFIMPNLETTQIFISKGKDKQTVVNPYSRIVDNKNKYIIDKCKNVD